MKQIFIYIVTCLMLVLQACTNEVEELFDTPAQQRMNQELKNCKELLVSAENGWILEYYPSPNQSYGGFVMTLKFTDKDVTASSEITETPSDYATSLYSLKSDMGPTLNFDSYNPIIHYFADPDNTGGAGPGKGYEGDYEFIIQSHSENEIILKGKKTKNIMRMTRLGQDSNSEVYLTELAQIRSAISSALLGVLGYTGKINGKDISFSIPSERKLSIQIGADQIINTAYNYTLNGIRLYQPISIGGQEVSQLEWSEKDKSFIISGTILSPIPDPIYPKYTKYLGKYTMSYFYGSTERNVPINIVAKSYTKNDKLYEVEGLPFPLQISYNVEKDCMEISTYTTSTYYVAVWEVTGEGNLTWSAGPGLIGQLKEGTDHTYEFVDNGIWGTYTARAIILWSQNGEYKEFGGDTRFQYITMTKQ